MLEFINNRSLYGTTKVGEKGQIVICKEAREVFDIKQGDNLAVIATKNRGIILIKVEDLKEFAHILESNV